MILHALSAGEVQATDELLPLVYEDLRKLAAARMAQLGPGQTLQATALVHDAYLRLVGSHDPGWEGRAHFFGAAARSMRNILANHLRHKGSSKRSGNYRRVGEDTAAGLASDGPTEDMLALEEALEELERDYPRKAEVVTLMFFGGLDAAEVAEVLGLASRTVERDWRFAKAWLNGRLTGQELEG
ncbi:MAG: RNA polymerase sigma factor (TIGR02999 family) [Planctomycetota bacterium]|jgi:RNA polymerase sigma factor (TIGR02999 family)